MLRLEKERKDRGWNKSDVSFRARIALSGYSRIERGKREPFNPELERLSNLFEVPGDQLMEEIEDN